MPRAPRRRSTNSWRKRGMVARAVAPSSRGRPGPRASRGRSGPPRRRSSRSATTASARPSSAGRKAMPTAYAPASGSSKPATSRKKASGIWVRMPAPSPESGSAPVAPRCSRLRRTVSACSTSSWLGLAGEGGDEADAAGVVLVAGVVQTLRGRASVHEGPSGRGAHGCRGIRIGSPVVVVAYAGAEGRRWPSAKKISCRLHDGAVLGKRILRSSMRTPRGRWRRYRGTRLDSMWGPDGQGDRSIMPAGPVGRGTRAP